VAPYIFVDRRPVGGMGTVSELVGPGQFEQLLQENLKAGCSIPSDTSHATGTALRPWASLPGSGFFVAAKITHAGDAPGPPRRVGCGRTRPGHRV
jgi:hypothetical protein